MSIALVAASLVSCSLGGGEESAPSPEERFISAEEVCGGVLSATAVQHLERASRATEFSTSFLPGDPTDLESLLGVLRETQEYEEQFCRIRNPASGDGMPAVQFYFRWAGTEPEERPEDSRFWEDPEAVVYDIGELAVTLGPSGAFLVFKCSVEGREGHMLSSRLHVHPEAHPDDRIGLLNAVARTVAEGLGCVEESGLTEAVPQPLPRSLG
ncbi:hypothetical protein [Streptomyces marincola]|uniref:hypothetical protein n=1 Tax=Streptomyces marincola TaxID=2878388 RepID=UPI001CF37A53|nr:hypothetical protein [Streptomyces marincola]UCM90578.1 hypothetical protein LC193_23030 [Streptomyces marincola]